MNFKALEEQLMELAEEMGGKEFVEELRKDKEAITQNPEQDEMDNEIDADFFKAKNLLLDVELIRVRMKECNLTLKQVQEQVGVSYRTVTRWLSRDDVPRQQNLTRLAEVLGLEPYQLFRSGMFGKQDILDENLRFAQRSIENLITEILEDEKMPKDKKVNALTKYYSVLIRAKKIVNEIEIILSLVISKHFKYPLKGGWGDSCDRHSDNRNLHHPFNKKIDIIRLNVVHLKYPLKPADIRGGV